MQPPRPDSHQQGGRQSIDAHQRIEDHGDGKEKQRVQIPKARQAAESPQQNHHRGASDGGDEGVAAQFEHIYPVAHVDDGQQQECHGDEHQYRPFVGHLEGAFRQCHQKQPPRTQQEHPQCGMIEKLREKRAEIGEHSTRHHHLLLEIQRGVEEKIHLLHFPEQVVLIHQQSTGDGDQRQKPYCNE